MRISSRTAAAALCLLTLILLGGCQQPGLSKQELISRGDAICKKTQDELNPLFAKLFPTGNETPPASEAASTMTTAARLVRQETDSLTKLEPQKELEKDYLPITTGLQQGAGLVEESAKLASEGNTEGYLQKLQEANRVDQDTRDLMVEFGFEDCGGGPPE